MAERSWDSPEPAPVTPQLDRPVLLVVAHSRTGSTRRMTDAVLAGASDPAIEEVDVVEGDPLHPDPGLALAAGAVIIGTPANFGYLSGAVKHWFDEIYRPLLDRTRGRPWAYYVKGATDTDGAVRALRMITTGLGWRQAAEPVVVCGELTDEHLAACWELGASMAARLSEDLR